MLITLFFITISISMACVDLFKCLLPYYLITIVVWLCVYLFKCLLPYYLITIPVGKSTSNRRRFNVVVDVETTSISGRKRKSNRR